MKLFPGQQRGAPARKYIIVGLGVGAAKGERDTISVAFLGAWKAREESRVNSRRSRAFVWGEHKDLRLLRLKYVLKTPLQRSKIESCFTLQKERSRTLDSISMCKLEKNSMTIKGERPKVENSSHSYKLTNNNQKIQNSRATSHHRV
jgi:hypothetical protein